jgi:hypothetical protein
MLQAWQSPGKGKSKWKGGLAQSHLLLGTDHKDVIGLTGPGEIHHPPEVGWGIGHDAASADLDGGCLDGLCLPGSCEATRMTP